MVVVIEINNLKDAIFLSLYSNVLYISILRVCYCAKSFVIQLTSPNVSNRNIMSSNPSSQLLNYQEMIMLLKKGK